MIDEMSGLTDFVDTYLIKANIPETSKQRLRAYVQTYSGVKDKEIAKNEFKMKMFGDKR